MKQEESLQKLDHKQLAAVYKKNGLFDEQRKLLLANFKNSQIHTNLLLKLKVMVESKIKNDPTILLKNKGRTAALIQGEVINGSSSGGSILLIVDKDIQERVVDSSEFHESLKVDLKDIKRKLEGVSDEDYAKQLEAEKRLRAEEASRREKEHAENELAYKNNFKVKQLLYPRKVVKPPTFNFTPKNARDRDGRRDDPYSRGLSYGGHLHY